MIINPQTDAHVRQLAQVQREDLADNPDPADRAAQKAFLVVKKLSKTINYDEHADRVYREVQTRVIALDAKLAVPFREGRVTRYGIRHYTSLTEYLKDPGVRRRIADQYNSRQLKEIGEQLIDVRGPRGGRLRAGTQLRENFDLGLYPDEQQPRNSTFRVTDTVLPSLNSPYGKQQLFHDIQESHRREWEAATRNPIGKRVVKLLQQFVLGRGLTGKIAEESHQEAWDNFWDRSELQLGIKEIFRELVIYGEIFLRYFNLKDKGLVVRSLDPSTIWDIITEPDDIQQVRYYHQQYVVAAPVFSAFVVDRPASTLIIRQILAADCDHFKINSLSTEKRGRGELYAILGWLLRLKEFMNDRIILNKMRAMFALDVSVEGGPTEMSQAEAQFETPPGSGAVLIHNSAVQVEYKQANTNANEAKTDAEMFLKIIAVGSGVSEQFLGVSSSQTRAGALIQTEPDVKNFEDYQEIVEQIVRKAYKRVVKAERLPKTQARFEVSFASIAQEDRSAKLKDLAMAEAMEWISAQRAASLAAKEFSITDYNHTSEQTVIRGERKKDVMVMQGFQSLPKAAPDPNMEQPALAGPPGGDGGAAEESKGLSHTSGQMGFRGDRGGRDLADTRPTLNRSAFTRGKEKASIKGRKSAGAPTYEAAAEPGKKPGWTAAARAKSLATRRAKALKRQTADAPTPEAGGDSTSSR